ncbi:DUF4468 domain-containing protein [Mucilaginibacter sabulilitoris]|uniref:DUF4468 domain-containing protein n=1 Tax=Mucilaginibacter sabulilitoris TaxID=1173583 RepID=A0ABZ0TIU0_9SPHI|nr:DUF4468 domain-containing protein [Mucilaginibacter sabulilitoris]WPU91105.1 DUF4468 domain-containing protein [Mucilaginibacter sabulilitoris]
MKYLFLFSFVIFFSIHTKAQSIEVSGTAIDTTNIIKLDSTRTKDQLYSTGLEWFGNTYKNSKSVIQVQDKEAGTIIGKATTALLAGTKVEYIDYTIKLYFKNGKIKYDIGVFEHSGYGIIKNGEVLKTPWGAKGIIKRQYAALQKKCNEEIYNLTASINKAFVQTTTKNDW